MFVFAGCESVLLSELARVGVPVLLGGLLLSPMYFAVGERLRARVLGTAAFLCILPGVIQVVLAVMSAESLCSLVLPRCLKAGPCWLSSFLLMLLVGVPLALLAMLAAIGRGGRENL